MLAMLMNSCSLHLGIQVALLIEVCTFTAQMFGSLTLHFAIHSRSTNLELGIREMVIPSLHSHRVVLLDSLETLLTTTKSISASCMLRISVRCMLSELMFPGISRLLAQRVRLF